MKKPLSASFRFAQTIEKLYLCNAFENVFCPNMAHSEKQSVATYHSKTKS